jgi:hypothetical protein
MSVRLQVIALALVLAPSAALAETPDLGWMSGHWRSTEDGVVSEEFWTDAAGGLMLGANRTVSDGRAVAFEHMRIYTPLPGSEAATVYCAQPGGTPATCFALVSWEDGRAQFENPDHDFPQRITYSREGDRLTATISDMADTQVMQFGWDAVTD